MSYTIKPELHPHVDKVGLRKIYIRLVYNRNSYRIGTNFKVTELQFQHGQVVNHPNAKKISLLLKSDINEIENRFLDAIKIKSAWSKEELSNIIKGKKQVTSISLNDFISTWCEQMKLKLSSSRIDLYNGLLVDVEDFGGTVYFHKISVGWLNKFETFLRSRPVRQKENSKQEQRVLSSNTINGKMTAFIAILNRAVESDYIDIDSFDAYKPPKYVQAIPEFITEEEMDNFFQVCKSMNRPGHQLAGYYFLLSCYTGFRISDLKKFDYEKMVQNNTILIRAKKNGSIVSIPVYKKLREVLNEIQDRPLNISEQKVREYVKEIALFVGISRKIKVHTARHSFAMMMVNRGLALDDVAELLGDTPTIARIYARISNTRLKKEILDKMQ